MRFQRPEDFAAQRFRRLASLEAQSEMTAFTFRELRFRLGFPLCLGHELFNPGISPQFQRLLPRTDRVRSMIGRELRKSKNGVGIGRIRRRLRGSGGVGKSLLRITRAHQERCVVIKYGGIVRLEAESGIEISAGLTQVAVLELLFSRDEIGGRGNIRARFRRNRLKSLTVYVALFYNLAR